MFDILIINETILILHGMKMYSMVIYYEKLIKMIIIRVSVVRIEYSVSERKMRLKFYLP